MRKSIYIMSKAPFMGISKTRLAKGIGHSNSRRLTLNNLENIRKIFLKKKIYSLFWYLKPHLKFRSYSFTFDYNCLKQVDNSMGKNIWNIFNVEAKPFVLIGSDIPSITFVHILNLFFYLKSHDITIGPSFDGGFWGIGFSNKKKISYPFNNVEWGTERTLACLTNNLRKNNINYKITDKLRDIDNKDDYCKNKRG